MNNLADMRKKIGHAPLSAAGAAVIVMQERRILLNLRADTNAWGIPGGAAAPVETPEETAARKLKEVTG